MAGVSDSSSSTNSSDFAAGGARTITLSIFSLPLTIRLASVLPPFSASRSFPLPESFPVSWYYLSGAAKDRGGMSSVRRSKLTEVAKTEGCAPLMPFV
jgi:hypothetical protein